MFKPGDEVVIRCGGRITPGDETYHNWCNLHAAQRTVFTVRTSTKSYGTMLNETHYYFEHEDLEPAVVSLENE